MLAIMPRCVVMSVVRKIVLKATPALVNVGYLAEAANGQFHMYNYHVDTLKIVSLGRFLDLPW